MNKVLLVSTFNIQISSAAKNQYDCRWHITCIFESSANQRQMELWTESHV